MASRIARPVELQYSVSDAAKLLGKSTRTIWRMVAARKFRPAPWSDNGLTRISASAINQFIEDRRLY